MKDNMGSYCCCCITSSDDGIVLAEYDPGYCTNHMEPTAHAERVALLMAEAERMLRPCSDDII